MEKKVREIFSLVFEIPVDKLPPDFIQSDIDNWDSIRHLKLIVELEGEFEIQFEPDEIIEMNSFHKIVELVNLKFTGK
jgi:acyl carrier protein